jgi:serine protease Do
MDLHRIRRQRGAAAVGLLGAFFVGGVAGALLGSRVDLPMGRGGRAVPFFVASSEPPVTGQISFASGFAPVVRRVQAAVVSVASARVVSTPEGPFTDSSLFADPFLRQFFGDPFAAPRKRREQSLGSGVIVSPEGYLLTNNHVVEGASTVRVSLLDNRQYDARIVGTDPKTDIAVIKVSEHNLPTLAFADSSKVAVGEFVLAVGNPFAIGQTVTMGIVSATARGNIGIADYEDFIQTDASINPGNSGGALVNARGDLVGINTAILSRGGGGNEGIGFAVPTNMARAVMEQILRQGKVVRGYLGVAVQPVTPTMARAFHLNVSSGAVISDVTPNSPAARAGFARGDVVVALNGEPVSDSRSLRLRIAQTPPGTTIRLKLLRDGATREVSVQLTEFPAQEPEARSRERQESSGLAGLQVRDLTPDIARQLGLALQTRGVVVVDADPGSAVAEAGLRRGDVIQEVNHRAVTSAAQFEEAVRQGAGQPVLLLVNREGSTGYLVVEPR